MSSSWSRQDPRQSMRLKLQSKEMLEILARLAELLTNREPEVTMGDERAWESLDGSVELQTVINDEPLTIIQGEFEQCHSQLRLTSCQTHYHSIVSFQT